MGSAPVIGLVSLNFMIGLGWLIRERKILSFKGKILVLTVGMPLIVTHLVLCFHAIVTGYPKALITEKMLYPTSRC